MDFIDNLMYATQFSELMPPAIPINRIRSHYVAPYATATTPVNVGSAGAPVFTYGLADKMDFCAYEDPIAIERTVLRHWHDIDDQVSYDSTGVTPFPSGPASAADRYISFGISSNYHLISAYLLENTRMLQIFERLIDKYLNDEEFGIASNSQVFNWIMNAERLFFKSDSPKSNIRSLIRPNSDATRRNAYWRMFGMDLAFGDINSTSNGSIPYNKARVTNQQFVPLFEKYLSEVWQSYMNANNTSGINSSDINVVTDLAVQLRELLIARRGDTAANRYSNLNLSREEFHSVMITSWFTFIISDDTPVVNFLNCQSSTIGERLHKIGNKVGIPAHSKCQALFEMAGAASNILTTVEASGLLDNAATMTAILTSLSTPGAPGIHVNLMTDLLTVINNWERATGHRIKAPAAANISATIKMQQNGVKPQVILN